MRQRRRTEDDASLEKDNPFLILACVRLEATDRKTIEHALVYNSTDSFACVCVTYSLLTLLLVWRQEVSDVMNDQFKTKQFK